MKLQSQVFRPGSDIEDVEWKDFTTSILDDSSKSRVTGNTYTVCGCWCNGRLNNLKQVIYYEQQVKLELKRIHISGYRCNERLKPKIDPWWNDVNLKQQVKRRLKPKTDPWWNDVNLKQQVRLKPKTTGKTRSKENKWVSVS